MKPNIQYLGLERSESIENFVLMELSKLHIWGTHEPHFYVWLECERSKIDTSVALFRCAIEVDGLKGNKKHFVEKKDSDFYLAVHKAIDALETIFRRDKGTHRNRQRRQLKRILGQAKAAS